MSYYPKQTKPKTEQTKSSSVASSSYSGPLEDLFVMPSQMPERHANNDAPYVRLLRALMQDAIFDVADYCQRIHGRRRVDHALRTRKRLAYVDTLAWVDTRWLPYPYLTFGRVCEALGLDEDRLRVILHDPEFGCKGYSQKRNTVHRGRRTKIRAKPDV